MRGTRTHDISLVSSLIDQSISFLSTPDNSSSLLVGNSTFRAPRRVVSSRVVSVSKLSDSGVHFDLVLEVLE